jgi:hypothetical protein
LAAAAGFFAAAAVFLAGAALAAAAGFFAAAAVFLAGAALVFVVVFLVAIDPCVDVGRHIVTPRSS